MPSPDSWMLNAEGKTRPVMDGPSPGTAVRGNRATRPTEVTLPRSTVTASVDWAVAWAWLVYPFAPTRLVLIPSVRCCSPQSEFSRVVLAVGGRGRETGVGAADCTVTWRSGAEGHCMLSW